MDRDRAIELLKQYLNEISTLRNLHYDNQDFKLWKSKIANVIKAGLEQQDLDTFTSARREDNTIYVTQPGVTSLPYGKFYQDNITAKETALKSVIQKYEILGIEEKHVPTGELPKAFIAHGGESPALDKLKSFLTALGIEPLVVEEQPSKNRSVGNNVDLYARQADCAIILATKGDIDGLTGSSIPRGNVLVEIGKAQEIFKDRIVYLLQAGTRFPTNVNEKVWVRFTSSGMDEAFIKVARELTSFGILEAVKPPREG